MTRVAFLGLPRRDVHRGGAAVGGRPRRRRPRLPYGSIPEVIEAVERRRRRPRDSSYRELDRGLDHRHPRHARLRQRLLIQREVVRPVSLNLIARREPARGRAPSSRFLCDRAVSPVAPALACRESLAANSTAGAVERVARSRQGDRGHRDPPRGRVVPPRRYRPGDRGPPRERDAVRDPRPRRAGADRARQDVHRLLPAENRPGSLISILQEFAARAINLTRLESRPTKAGLGDYCFVIDCEGHVSDELVADALRNLHAKQGGVKFLGSYPAAAGDDAGGPGAMRPGRAWREASIWVEELRARIGTS